jgi:hypothetical protein
MRAGMIWRDAMRRVALRGCRAWRAKPQSDGARATQDCPLAVIVRHWSLL